MDLAFWPAANSEAWAGTWRAYPGVWLLVGATWAALAFARRWPPDAGTAEASRSRRRTLALAGGLAMLWLTLDWPLGSLAAGYLLSAAALQYLLLSLVVPPLLLLSLPPIAGVEEDPDRRQGGARRWWRPPLPLLGGAAFAGVLFGTANPRLVDALRPSVAGSWLVTLLWLGSALLLWWPLLRRRPPMGYMAGVAYLFVPFLLPKVPGLVYIVADGPMYATYTDAPRVAGLAFSAAIDQRAAGVVLWSAGTVMVFVSLGVLFFHWYRDEHRATSPGSLQLPADPEVVEAIFAIPGGWTLLERVIGSLEAELLSDRAGTELRFALRDRAGVRQVVLEVHALLDGAAVEAVEARIARDRARHMARVRPEQRALLDARLRIEVVRVHVRAT
jgi:cytochrome c oxidase assembly factor CtaG